jgi:hypothetical protein
MFVATACPGATAVTKPAAGVTGILASDIASSPESWFSSSPELLRSTQAVPLVQLVLACENIIMAAAGGVYCRPVGASKPSDFVRLAVPVLSLVSRGCFVSRIPSARERCVLAVEGTA